MTSNCPAQVTWSTIIAAGGNNLMASSGFAADAVAKNQVSLLVSADDTRRFFDDRGFFYQENAEIGKLVDQLYNTSDFRNPEAKLNYTSVLRKDPCIQSILDRYPTELPLRIPWGTTPNGFYNWVKKKDPRADNDLTVCLLGPGSTWRCRVGSYKLGTDGERHCDGNYALSDANIADYPVKEVVMKEGGVLLAKPRVAQQAISGRSFVVGRRKKREGKAAGAPQAAE